jgi:ATP-binding cassette subfamily C protein LapB
MAGAIEMRDVHFTYPGQKQGAIAGVSLSIRPGERVALVGRVGSGKSTILSLLMGLYRPDRGEILFDGLDSRQIEPAHLRSQVGSVLQDIWLMSGTVRENIALGADDPSDEAVVLAARMAGVHDFVATHPDGYGMKLRERGAGLSGGQRQAIAVARALVGDPPILLMDEPTSATDIQGEQALIERMKALPQGRTVVLVTHRPSMLALVDRLNPRDPSSGRRRASIQCIQFLEPDPGATLEAIAAEHFGVGGFRFIPRSATTLDGARP